MREFLRQHRSNLGRLLLILAIVAGVFAIFPLLLISFNARLFLYFPPSLFSLIGFWLLLILAAAFFGDTLDTKIASLDLGDVTYSTRMLKLLSRAARYFLFLTFMLFLVYVASLLFQEFLPFTLSYKIGSVAESSFTYIIFGLIPSILLLNQRIRTRVLLASVMIPIFICLLIVQGLAGERTIAASVKLGENRYHLELTWIDWANYRVIECDNKGLNCHSIYSTYGGDRELVVDESLGELYLFRGGSIEFVYSEPEGFSYSNDYILAGAFDRFGEIGHDVQVLEDGNIFRVVMIIQYFGEDRHIDVLPVRIYIDPESDFWKPVFDGRDWGYKKDGDIYIDLQIDDAGETSVYVEHILIYSYGSQSECHVEGCEIVGP